jgi:hypothetical protein
VNIRPGPERVSQVRDLSTCRRTKMARPRQRPAGIGIARFIHLNLSTRSCYFLSS